jgi:ribonuclease G
VVNKDLIIDVGDSEVSLALLEDKQLIELNKEKRNVKFSVGDIYLGKVKKIMPGLNAAFINVGYERDAFLQNAAQILSNGSSETRESTTCT